jgi:ParB/RepB/Spo0J family partition protein
MPQQLLVSEIEDNPFQSRKSIDKAAVDRLAEEIKREGFWHTTFRVRRHNGTYQMVAGHQRLRALKKNGVKRVDVEVVDLDDIQMAQESLIENIQRTALVEMDRAEAIAKLYGMMTANRPESRGKATEELCELLGYKSPTTLNDYLLMAGFSAQTKEVVRRENMPRSAARIAKKIGGEKMVRTAAVGKLNRDDLDPMFSSLQGLPEDSRKKIVDKIIERKIKDPDVVKKMARVEAEKGLDLEKYNPDIMLFCAKWAGDLRVWTKKIKAATKVKAYVHQHPEILGEFRTAAEEFWSALKELLDL